jgi:hypothetical protein
MAFDNEPEEPIGVEMVREMHQRRLEAARSQYETAINRLWAGCGGGLIGVVSILRHPNDLFFWLSAASFGLGILFLGVGAVLTLVSSRTVIRHLEDVHGILEVRMKYFERLSDEAGLSLSHPQTWAAFAAAGLFLLGVVFAGILLWRY